VELAAVNHLDRLSVALGLAARRERTIWPICSPWSTVAQGDPRRDDADSVTGVLSAEQVRDYERDGVLVVEDFVPIDRCRALIDRADELMTGWSADQRSVFTTSEQDRVSDDYFLGSGDTVRFFFDTEVFGPDGELVAPVTESVNKIGHALHDLDPVFEEFSYSPELAEVAHDVGMTDPVALQSMYLCKQPRIGGEVGCHQDATFLYTDPITVTGFWFALEDATLDNGCLWAAPGAHRSGLRRQFRRAPGGGTVFVDLDPEPLPAPDELVPFETPAGTLVVLHGLLPHWSDVNRSDRSRHAYSLHCVCQRADYPSWNWLQRPALPLRSLGSVAEVR
jgi:phytanoyl-CoA hydroxylase